MKFFIASVVSMFFLISILSTAYAIWAKKLSDTELIEQSDLIIAAELLGQTQVMINQVKLVLGVLKVEEVLKGDKNQTVLLLALPSPEGPRKSDDIFYKKGQKGLWFLHERKAKGEAGIYLADGPQRFLPMKQAADRIKAIRKIMKNKPDKSEHRNFKNSRDE